MYHLVVTEKPSVAQSIAAVIGARQRKDGYLEGNGYLVSWCIGHLVELADPTAYGNFEKWRNKFGFFMYGGHILVKSELRAASISFRVRA